MTFDPVVAIIVTLIIVVALLVGKTMFADRANKRDMRQVDVDRREERAHQERLEQERQERYEEARKEEAEAMDAARKQMAFTQEHIHDVHQAFQACHDELIERIHLQAKEGCDVQFQQRFGITRPPKAATPEDDVEAQDYLREHYADLRDSVLVDTIEHLMQEEVDRRIAAQQAADDEDASAVEDAAEITQDAEVAEEPEEAAAETPTEDAEAPAESEGDAAEAPTDDEPAQTEEPADSAAPAEETTDADEPDDEVEGDDAPDEPEIDRAPIEAAVREEFDVDSIRTYLLAAISARYDGNGKPIGDLPWPAFTSISNRGYGELVLAEGAPVYAQDSYREFAWKKFHTGRRAEKPTRGEYSWPESHELGDGIAVENVPTPAGVFTVQGPKGACPLYELLDCAWIRHSLEYQGALLVPDGQRSFFVNLEGMRKGDTIALQFDAPDFLEEADDGPYFLNAFGEVNGAYVGISASKPEAANLGEAPYELAERTPTGLVFRMTHDARRFDVDTYPQFLEAHVAWCQPPAPRPERIIRHVTN